MLPVDKTVEFKLHSPDVIHDFGVPGFLERMDVIPGPVSQDNHFQVTPTVIGDYRGKCYELCGVYHSRMLFNVKVVSEADFQAYLQQLQAQGNVSDQPLLGGIEDQTQAGLETTPGVTEVTATTPSTARPGRPRPVVSSAGRSSRSSPPPTTR